MKRLTQLALATALLVGGPLAAQQTARTTQPRPDQQRFRANKELVETNTTLSSGSCTLAAERMAAHLREAGYPGTDLTLFSVPEHPKDGGLVVVGPAEQLGEDVSGRSLIPAMSTGASDSIYLAAAGIPSYGGPASSTDMTAAAFTG